MSYISGNENPQKILIFQETELSYTSGKTELSYSSGKEYSEPQHT